MEGTSAIAQNTVKISGYNSGNAIVYSNLVLTEAMISVNHFSFSMRPDNNEGSLSAILNIKKQILGKETEIKFSNLDNSAGHVFKGYVNEVNALLGSDGYYEFHVTGNGKFAKVNEIPEARSYYKKNVSDIINATFKDSSIKNDVKVDTQTGEQHYIVQYNQSPFSFAATMATRFGEWMYYDGEKLKFGKAPDGDGVSMRTNNNEIFNLNIRSKSIKPPEALIATDINKSEVLNANKKESDPTNDFLKASLKGGEFMEHLSKKSYVPSGFNKHSIEAIHKIIQEALVASSVYITAASYNATLTVGTVIKVKESDSDAGVKYIVTQISHSSAQASNYANRFTAVPADVKVPPYTNPLCFPKATPQAAVVTDNDDKDGLSRVKVKFPWMAENEKTPWISVVVPHAGKDKGFRFLPEKDDEVMVDFWDNNAEIPYVNGAVYTDKNKAGVKEESNNIKRIGSKTGRRFEINDEGGSILIYDYGDEKDKKGNFFEQHAADGDLYTKITSGNNDEFLVLALDARGKKLGIMGKQSGTEIVSIMLDMGEKKITIESKGDIEIKADGNISMSATSDINIDAQKININAKNELSMKGTSKVAVSGTQIAVAADAKLEMKGNAQASLEGAMLDLKGSGITNVQGALVKIN